MKARFVSKRGRTTAAVDAGRCGSIFQMTGFFWRLKGGFGAYSALLAILRLILGALVPALPHVQHLLSCQAAIYSHQRTARFISSRNAHVRRLPGFVLEHADTVSRPSLTKSPRLNRIRASAPFATSWLLVRQKQADSLGWIVPEIIRHFAIDSIASSSIKPCDGGVFEALNLLLKVERTACGFMACSQSAQGCEVRGLARNRALCGVADLRRVAMGSKNPFRVWPWAGLGSCLCNRNFR